MKITKHGVFGFILGLVIASSVGVIAYSISASNITFESSNENFKATNVQEAMDELYEKSTGIGNGFSISDSLIIDSTNQNKIFTYDTISPGNYMLIEKGALYAFGSASYSTWNIGSFSTTKKVPTNGILFHDGSGNSFVLIYTFTITEEAIPSVTVYNYYPSSSSKSYNFWLVKLS